MNQFQPLASLFLDLRNRSPWLWPPLWLLSRSELVRLPPEVLVPVPAHWCPTLGALRMLWILVAFPVHKKFRLSSQSCLLSLLPALNWCTYYRVRDLRFSPLWWDASFHWCWVPRKRESRVTLLWRENWLPHGVSPYNWTFAPQAIDLGKMESNLLWETLCNISFKKKKSISWFQKDIANS